MPNLYDSMTSGDSDKIEAANAQLPRGYQIISGRSFVQVQTYDYDFEKHFAGDGWKFHLSVTPADLPRATEIVMGMVEKHGVQAFKVTTPDAAQRFNDPSNPQAGKQFTLYGARGDDNFRWDNVIRDIELKFTEAGIRPSVPYILGDRMVPGSRYAGYRNDLAHGRLSQYADHYGYLGANKIRQAVEDGRAEAGWEHNPTRQPDSLQDIDFSRDPEIARARGEFVRTPAQAVSADKPAKQGLFGGLFGRRQQPEASIEEPARAQTPQWRETSPASGWSDYHSSAFGDSMRHDQPFPTNGVNRPTPDMQRFQQEMQGRGVAVEWGFKGDNAYAYVRKSDAASMQNLGRATQQAAPESVRPVTPEPLATARNGGVADAKWLKVRDSQGRMAAYAYPDSMSPEAEAQLRRGLAQRGIPFSEYITSLGAGDSGKRAVIRVEGEHVGQLSSAGVEFLKSSREIPKPIAHSAPARQISSNSYAAHSVAADLRISLGEHNIIGVTRVEDGYRVEVPPTYSRGELARAGIDPTGLRRSAPEHGNHSIMIPDDRLPPSIARDAKVFDALDRAGISDVASHAFRVGKNGRTTGYVIDVPETYSRQNLAGAGIDPAQIPDSARKNLGDGLHRITIPVEATRGIGVAPRRSPQPHAEDVLLANRRISEYTAPEVVAEIEAAKAGGELHSDGAQSAPNETYRGNVSANRSMAGAVNGLGVAMGAYGLYKKFHDQDSLYHQDMKSGDALRRTAAQAGVVADAANIATGAVATAADMHNLHANRTPSVGKPPTPQAASSHPNAVRNIASSSEGTVARAAAVADDAAKITEEATAAVVADDAARVTEEATAAVNAAKFGKIGRIAGRAAIPLAVAAGGVVTYAATRAGDRDRASGAIGGTVGGILGGIAVGAAAGAVIGGTAGSVVPGIGTVAVGVVAGIVGGIGGAFVGEAAAKRYASSAVGWLTGVDGKFEQAMKGLNPRLQAFMDQNHDRKRDVEDVHHILKRAGLDSIDKIDTNHDGKLSSAELNSALTGVIIDKELGEKLAELNAKSWGKVVGNKDGKLTLNELKAALPKGLDLLSLDKDHNGDISGREITDALMAVRPPATPAVPPKPATATARPVRH